MKKNQEFQNAADLQEMAVRLVEVQRQLQRVKALAGRYNSLNEKADRNFRLDVANAEQTVYHALAHYFPYDMVEELKGR